MQHRPGSIGLRILAQIIDAIILIPFVSIIQTLMQDNEILAVIASMILNMAYYVYFLGGNWQATPGKRIMGLYVTDIAGDPLNYESAALRFFAFILPNLPVYASLGDMAIFSLLLWLHILWFLPMFLTEKKRGVHDYLAYTQVWEGRIT